MQRAIRSSPRPAGSRRLSSSYSWGSSLSTIFLMPFSALARGSITSRPQRVHLSLMSMPTRVTSHIFSPQGCGFFISTRSFSLRSIALPLDRFPVLRGGALGLVVTVTVVAGVFQLVRQILLPDPVIGIRMRIFVVLPLRAPTVSAKIIEALGTADTALLRPEGLLTGEPTAVDIRPAGMEAGQFLALAASVMQDCNAPEATAILNTAHSCGITVPSTGHCTQTPDGFCAELDGKRYYAGTSEQLRRRGIFAPRADDISLSGKTALLFGMEGGMYLGLIALQSPLLLGAPEACRVLAAQRLRLAIPAGSQPLYIRQLASQTNTEVIEAAGPEQALMQLAQRGRPICIRAGEPSTYLQEQIPILSVQTLADAEDPISVCRRAVHTRRSLQGFSAVCTFLLAGAAGGLFAPALDLGAKPAFCVLLACFLTGMTLLPVLTGKCKNAAAACIAENKLPQTISSESKPPEQETPSHTLTIRMEELPAMPGKAALEQALLAVPGVQTAEADYESGLILVTGTAEKELLLRAISKAAEA